MPHPKIFWEETDAILFQTSKGKEVVAAEKEKGTGYFLDELLSFFINVLIEMLRIHSQSAKHLMSKK